MGRETDAQVKTFAWPTDEDGNPMALISMQASELIGLPQYSNVTVGPAMVQRFVPDTEEGRYEGLKEAAKTCERIVGEERSVVLEIVAKKA